VFLSLYINIEKNIRINNIKSPKMLTLRFLFPSVYLLLTHTLIFFAHILYKYILLVRVICEKYRLRGEANIQSRFSGEGHLTVLETGIFRK